MKLQLKRSDAFNSEKGEAIAPDIRNMEFGEIAINYSQVPTLFTKRKDGGGGEIMQPLTSIKDIELKASAGITVTNGKFNLAQQRDQDITIELNSATSEKIGGITEPNGTGLYCREVKDGNFKWNKLVNADGSASFAGNVGIGGANSSAPKITLNAADGSISAAGAYYNPRVSILATDGSATFGAGSLTIAGDGTTRIGGASASPNITLNANGSASFAGEVKIGGGGSTSNDGITLNDNGYAYFARSNSVTPLMRGYRTDTGANTFTVLADGSATFAGNIVSGGPSVNGGTDKGSFIGYEGNSGFTAGSSSSAIRVWTQGDSTPTVDILGSGSATFAGYCNQRSAR